MKKIVWIFGGLIITLGLVLPFCFVPCMNPNLATLISGIWSALATVTLGLIALWQNKKYKQLADQQNDLAFMPDLYISTALSDELAAASSIVSFSKVRGIIDDIETVTCQPINLWFLRGPILNLKVVEIQHREETWVCSDCYPKSFRDENKPIFFVFDIPKNYSKENESFTAVLEYENVYGTRYQKKVPFSINVGSLNPDVEKLERAYRVDNG